MKRLLVLITVAVGLCLFPACKKGSSNPSTSEANLDVVTTPANGTFQSPSIEPFILTVEVKSAMPAGGVKIDVSAKKDDGSGSAPFFTDSRTTTSALTTFTITNTPVGVQCIVEIKVTSLSKSSNQWTGSYHYSRKS